MKYPFFGWPVAYNLIKTVKWLGRHHFDFTVYLTREDIFESIYKRKYL